MKKILTVILITITAAMFYSCESNDDTIISNTPSSTVPQLLSPENNSSVSTLTPSFDWNDFPNSVSYSLQVSLNPSYTSLIIDTAGLSVSEYNSPSEILNDSTSYYWRVKSISANDTTQWSNSFSFSTSLESIIPTNKILVELFTNTSCIPCVEANTYLDEIYNRSGVTSNDASVEILRIHTTLFAGDPFYLYNTADNNARMAFYPNSAIVNPRTFLLGVYMGNFSAASWTNKLNEMLADTRTYAIKLANVYDSVSGSGNINIKIKQVSGAVYNDLVYHVAVAENEIPYNAPNGETHFSNTLRDLVTAPSGQPFTISPGQTISYNQNYSIDSQLNKNKTDLIVFIQRNNTTTREVMAVEKIKLR
jgi:hypothetical protein